MLFLNIGMAITEHQLIDDVPGGLLSNRKVIGILVVA